MQDECPKNRQSGGCGCWPGLAIACSVSIRPGPRGYVIIVSACSQSRRDDACAAPFPCPRIGFAASACATRLPFDDVVTAFDYRFPIDRLVHRFKFSADLATGAYLGEALARAVAGAPAPDLVLASPASPARLRERGFNPALVLARRVASRLGVAIDARGDREGPPHASPDGAGPGRPAAQPARGVCRPATGWMGCTSPSSTT